MVSACKRGIQHWILIDLGYNAERKAERKGKRERTKKGKAHLLILQFLLTQILPLPRRLLPPQRQLHLRQVLLLTGFPTGGQTGVEGDEGG